MGKEKGFPAPRAEHPPSMSTSKEESKAASVEERRRSPLDHLPPPANSNKPLTPFSIEDILNKPSVRRSYTICGTAHLLAAAAAAEKHPPTAALPLATSRALLSQTSPLCALEELASKTFKGLEVSVLQAAEGKKTGWRGGSAGDGAPAGLGGAERMVALVEASTRREHFTCRLEEGGSGDARGLGSWGGLPTGAWSA